MNFIGKIKNLFKSKNKREAEERYCKRTRDQEARRKLGYPFTCEHCILGNDPDICEACPEVAAHWSYYDFTEVWGLDRRQGRHFFIRCKDHHASCKEHIAGKPCITHTPPCDFIITTKEECLAYLIMNG